MPSSSECREASEEASSASSTSVRVATACPSPASAPSAGTFQYAGPACVANVGGGRDGATAQVGGGNKDGMRPVTWRGMRDVSGPLVSMLGTGLLGSGGASPPRTTW